MIRTTLLCLFVVSCFSLSTWAQLKNEVPLPSKTESLPKTEPATKTQRPAKEVVPELIKQMISTNPEPVIEGAGDAAFWKVRETPAQKQAFAAFIELKDYGPAAYPYLVEHFNDQRYSFTEEGFSAFLNYKVGYLCRYIVEKSLQPYGGIIFNKNPPPLVAGYHANYFKAMKLDDPQSFAVWWETHQHKTLYELQVEAMEWAVAEELKNPTAYPKEEIKKMQQHLADLKKSGQAIKTGAPWPK